MMLLTRGEAGNDSLTTGSGNPGAGTNKIKNCEG